MFIIRNNKHVLIYLSRMKYCLWGWSCYHYSLAQRPTSHRKHFFLATFSMMQVRHLQTQLINKQLRNRLRVNMVCEWAWVSIPGEHHLPKLVLFLGAQITRTGTYTCTHTGKRAHLLLITMAQKYRTSAH